MKRQQRAFRKRENTSEDRPDANEGATILVVDDSPDDLEALAAVLRLEGYRVMLSSGGHEALQLVQQTCPDLAIVDVSMPGMDGFDLCQRLRTFERTRVVPIILVSSVRTETVDQARGLDAGADDFMLKPLDRQVLRARIDSLLRLGEVREELRQESNRLRTLNYAVARLMAVSTMEGLPALAVSAAIGVSGCRQAALFLLDERREMLRLVTVEGLSAHYQDIFRALSLEDPRAAAIVEGTRMIPDVLAGSYLQDYQDVAVQEGFRAVAEIPLRGAEQVWGMLAFYYAAAHYFSEGETEILVTLSNQIAVVFERLRHFSLEKRRRRIAESLQRVAQIINVTLDSEEVLHLILRQLRSVVPYRSAYIVLRQGELFNVAAYFGEIDSQEAKDIVLSPQENPTLQDVIAGGRPIVVSYAREDERVWTLPGESAAGSWMSMPLVVQGETIGLLVVSSAHEGTYADEIAEIAQNFARQAAIAVEKTRLFQRVQEEQFKLEAILNQTTDAVLAVDLEKYVLIANPAVQRLLGLPPRQLRGELLSSVLHGKHEALSILFDQASQGLTVVAEVPGTDSRRLYASVSPVENVGTVAVIQDITPLKELEQMHLRAERAERDRIRQTLERYVGPDLVDQVLVEEGGLLERRERVEAVVLFADIRGFTSAAATLPPEAAVEMLNEFFEAMARVIYHCEGTVIDLIGDELMASFGAPLPRPDAGQRAVEAAVGLQMEFPRLQSSWSERWGVSVSLGVGIDRGLAVMGNIGTADRVSFTLIGNVVNRAHRLVEQAGPDEILLSGAVLEVIPEGQRPWGALEEVPEILAGGPERAYRLRLRPR